MQPDVMAFISLGLLTKEWDQTDEDPEKGKKKVENEALES